MTDSRAVIPAMAWINAQIIIEADSWQWFHDCTRRVIDTQGYNIPEHYRVINPAMVVSMLYCLLVVPKEVWLRENAEHYQELERMNPLQYFRIESLGKKDNETETRCLIRRLRNSVAHASYTFERNEWTFTDRPKGDETMPDFVVHTTLGRLSDFIGDVGKYLANVGLDSRQE